MLRNAPPAGAQGERRSDVLASGWVPPDLAGLKQRNDGYFPREFVSRFVMGQLAKDDRLTHAGLLCRWPPRLPQWRDVDLKPILNLLDYLEAISGRTGVVRETPSGT